METAKALASAGAAVTLAVRTTVAGESVADDIRHTTGNDDVTVAPLDLADLSSVAAVVAGWSEPLHTLAPYAMDTANAARLWELSEHLVATA